MISQKQSQPTNFFSRWVLVFLLVITFTTGLSVTQGASAAPAARVIYVKKSATGANTGTSWTNAYTNLQSALTEASEGDEIWVATGVYTPTLQTAPPDPRSTTFKLKQGVAMYGGFDGSETFRTQRDWRAHRTVLSGDLAGNDGNKRFNPDNPANDPEFSENSYHVVTASGVTRPTRLDGFTIRNGNAYLSSGEDLLGGGLFVKEEGSVDEGSPELVNLVFFNNNAVSGGAHYSRKSISIIIDCAYIGNYADYGGGLRTFESTPVLTHTLTLANVVFSGNYARTQGGAINNYASSLTLLNGTLANNSAGVSAETILNSGTSTFTAKNSIFWGNLAGGEKHIVTEGGSSATLRYSLIQNGCAGNDVDTCTKVDDQDPVLDPLFIDADGEDNLAGTLDDYPSLESNSPAVDAGANSAVYNDELDLDEDTDISERLSEDLMGETRFKDMPATDTGEGFAPLVDMGAYEVQIITTSSSIYLPIILR